jgi:hypothetical protein
MAIGGLSDLTHEFQLIACSNITDSCFRMYENVEGAGQNGFERSHLARGH